MRTVLFIFFVLVAAPAVALTIDEWAYFAWRSRMSKATAEFQESYSKKQNFGWNGPRKCACRTD